MKALIIDDSEIDRLNLRTLLEDHPRIEILGEGANLATARELVARHQPDLIFLDIHLGKEKGFHLLDSLDQAPHIILTTSHPQYALKGFEVAALDYILKPVTEENLKRAVSRLPEKSATDETALLTTDSPLLFKNGDEHRLHPVSDIVLIKTDRPYTRVHTTDGSDYLHRRSLSEWNRILPQETFLALDRSCLVNLTTIDRLTPEGDKSRLHFLSESVPSLLLGLVATKKLHQALGA